MQTLYSRWIASCLFLFCGLAQSPAQVVSCHLEYSREQPQLTRITLVNDSEKTVEAFRLIQRCYHGGGARSGDILDFSGTAISSMHAADGAILRRSGLGRGDTWDAGFLNSEGAGNSARECVPELTAILFAGGSYEGSEDVVRALKARRDGIRDSVDYWVERFAREDPANPSLEAIHTETQERVSHDRSEINANNYNFLGDNPEPSLHSYWTGREQVDMNIELWARPDSSRHTVADQWRQLANNIDRWKKKVAEDVAMKVLDAQFPPVSPGKPAAEVAPSSP
jgi:hypothetical protein